MNDLPTLGHISILCSGVRRIMRVPYKVFLLIMYLVREGLLPKLKSEKLLPKEMEMDI